MSRRRLRIISSSSSSDEEDKLPVRNLELELLEEDVDIEIELKEPTLNLETVTLNSSNLDPTYSEPVHLEISDDEFVDVSENFSSPSPPHQPSISSESVAMKSTSQSSLPAESVSSSSSRISSSRTSIPNNVSSPQSIPIPPSRASTVTGVFTSQATDCPIDASSSRISSNNTIIPNNVSSAQSIPIPPFRASTVGSTDTSQATDCPIDCSLRDIGLRLHRNWLDSCIHGLESAVTFFSSLDHGAKAKLCFEQVLLSDMNQCGSGVLPANVHDMHLVDLQGPFVLQVDEIVNISCPLRCRYQNAHSGLKRCLKLCMTDGVQRVFGMEYRPIKDLEVLAPAGLKVAICNVHVRRGLLMLVPEVFRVLGGHVEVLEAARQRLVNEVNKPARGKRTRTGVLPPLATRATHAAWAPDRVFVPPQTDTTLPQTDVQEASDVPIPQSNVLWDDFDDVHMVDSVEQVLTTTDREVPFTYLSDLFAKWVSMEDHNALQYVQGKIKCFVTGVKGFQFKERPTYELRVYVDDGSLISEIMIHHDVVQDMVGHSPQEVTAALASSDTKRIGDMKERLKQFQYFLANFEGMMVVEITGGSLPIAKEMNQGSTVSDAWLLLRRLKAQQPFRRQFLDGVDPIDISP